MERGKKKKINFDLGIVVLVLIGYYILQETKRFMLFIFLLLLHFSKFNSVLFTHANTVVVAGEVGSVTARSTPLCMLVARPHIRLFWFH